jgi:xanthine dehydrogenase YagR molybdenum-binding subunit
VSIGAAIGNAVYNAIGVRVRRIPMTPAVVLAALNNSDRSNVPTVKS